MKTFNNCVTLLVAMLILASIANSRADEPKPEVPDGYGQADQAGQVGQPAKALKKEPANDKKEKSDVPVGYEDTEQAGKSRKKPRKRIVVPAVPQANNQQRLDPKELLKKNPQLKALADQMRAQIQPIFGAELTFAKQVCQPNELQLQKMKALAAPELEKTLQSFVVQQAPRMGIQIAGVRARPRQQQASKIFDDFEASASRIVANIFPAETIEIYQNEKKHRQEFRSRSGAMMLVAHLDTQFRLSRDQREKLTDSLQQVWRREWQHYLQIMASNPQFFPPVPDKSVLPHLSGIQLKRWKSMQRQQLGMNWQNINNNGQFRNLQPEVDWFEKQGKGAAVDVIQFLGGAVLQIEAAAADAAEEADE